jgi:hypothetical protein
MWIDYFSRRKEVHTLHTPYTPEIWTRLDESRVNLNTPNHSKNASQPHPISPKSLPLSIQFTCYNSINLNGLKMTLKKGKRWTFERLLARTELGERM